MSDPESTPQVDPTTTEGERTGMSTGPAGESPPAAALVLHLADQLAAAGVRYCHWKNTAEIMRSLSGENDLDLLVARRDATRFESVLHELGFRLARPAADRQVPGILDFYGLDEGSARLIHVHAHFQIAVGDRLTTSVRLPLEEAYLGSASTGGVLPVPNPDFEYLLFVLRMVARRATWDAQLGRKGRLTASELGEMRYLEERIDPQAVETLRVTHLPFVEQELFEACRQALGKRSGRLHRAKTAGRLLQRLDAQARRPRSADTAVRIWRRLWQPLQLRVLPFTHSRRFDSGGLVIGVLGGDGSGKSSAVAAVGDFLGRDFVLRRFHLGKPPRSLLTRVVKRPLRRLRDEGWLQATTLPAWTEFDRFPGYGFMLWHLLTARDRHREYRRARRLAGAGGIALCDRYPTPSIRLMDSPRTIDLPGISRRPLARWMVGRESAYYREILPPDLLVVLRVPPEVAVGRRHDEEAEFVSRRAAEVFRQSWKGASTVVVDAGRPHDEVLAEIRAAVWAVL